MAVHDEAPAVDPVAIGEERLAHPHHHLVVLLVERSGQINAGMHEEAQPVVMAERQGAQPGEMSLLDAAMGAPIVALRGGAAVPQPQRHGALVLVRRDRHLLMVAAQADHRGRLRLLPPHQEFDHAPAVRPTIDVVAETDEARRPAGGMGLARRQQAAQLVETAVDIADREGDGWHERTRAGGDGARLQARGR